MSRSIWTRIELNHQPLYHDQPVQLPGDKRTGVPPVPLVQGAPAEVEVFPGAEHLPGHGVQVVPLVLGTVVEAVSRLEGWTLIAGACLVTVTPPRLSSKHNLSVCRTERTARSVFYKSFFSRQ